MRIVSRAELMQHPPGTVFRHYEPFIWIGEWCELVEVLETDFVFEKIGLQIDRQAYELNDADHLAGKGLTYSDGTSRDGMFDHDALYVILDAADIEAHARQWAKLGGFHVS